MATQPPGAGVVETERPLLLKALSTLTVALSLSAQILAPRASLATPLTAHGRAQIVGSSAGHFWLNGEPFRFIGHNVRGFIHYGEGDVLYWSQPQDRILSLQVLQNTGGRVIRVFGSNKYLSNEELGDRLEYCLNLANSYGIKILYAFTDYYYNGFHPKGDDKYYSPSGGYTLLNDSFFTGGYQENYLPQVVYLVNRFKDHPALFAWELGNEVKHPANPNAFYNFCMYMHSVIRSIDPNHMIDIGLISTYPHTGWNQTQANTVHSTFDFLSLHVYNGEESNEMNYANVVGKPLLVGEAGFSSGDRPQSTSNDIAKWIGRGARGYMQWGLMASAGDNGDGDRSFGIDQVWHTDWDDYLLMYSNWAQQLATTSTPPAVTPRGVSATDGAYPDKVTVTWDFEPSAKQYAVFRSDTPGGQKTQISAWSLTLSYDDTSAIPGVTYSYSVKARNNGGESGFSSADAGSAASGAYGSVSGVVRDQQSNLVAGVKVILSPGEYTQTTGGDGAYAFGFVPAGNYSLTALKTGWQPAHVSQIEVAQSQNAVADVSLKLLSAIQQIKALEDGASVATGGVVTAVSGEGSARRIYIQSPDRSGGIGVLTSENVSENDSALIDGTLVTVDGERLLQASAVHILGVSEPARALSMGNKALGGGACGLQSAVVDNAASNQVSPRLNNVGLLVTTWGRVSFVSADGLFFYLDDGSGISDGSGHTGVRVWCEGLPRPAQGQSIWVRGISGVTVLGGRVVRLLRPRSLADLSYLTHIELVNAGFETGTLQGWTEYNPTDKVISGTWFGSITAHSGQKFLGSAANGGMKSGGVYQRVATAAGLSLQARVWSRVYHLGNPADSAQNKVGIDPAGGTNPNAGTVQWSPADIQPVEAFSEWTQLSTPVVQATGEYVTVFLDMRHTTAAQWKVNALDDAELAVVIP